MSSPARLGRDCSQPVVRDIFTLMRCFEQRIFITSNRTELEVSTFCFDQPLQLTPDIGLLSFLMLPRGNSCLDTSNILQSQMSLHPFSCRNWSAWKRSILFSRCWFVVLLSLDLLQRKVSSEFLELSGLRPIVLSYFKDH